MQDVWHRIEAWLRKHAPALSARLPAGVSQAELAAAEEALGVRLPEEVRSSYALHNGSPDLWPFDNGPLLSLAQVVAQWGVWRDLLRAGTFAGMRSSPIGPVKRDWWNPRWVPVAGASGDHDCLDLDPAPGGRVGQVIDFGHEGGATSVFANSFREYLTSFA